MECCFRFRFEYTLSDTRVYKHRFKINDYYSYNYPLGFWAGPHAEELYMDYSFDLFGNQIKLLFSNAKRGEYTDSMRVDQYGRPYDVAVYERFETENIESCGDCMGTVESKQLMRISVNRKILGDTELLLQYTYIDWENSGFNPIIPESEDVLPNITKHSIGLGLQYRY